MKQLGIEILIRFHSAQNNHACTALLNNSNCICVFTGPDAYISPDYYDLPNQVPTWNYLSIECEGDVGQLISNEPAEFAIICSGQYPIHQALRPRQAAAMKLC